MKKLVKSLALFAGALLHPDRSAKIIFYHDIGRAYTSMGTPSTLFWRHMQILVANRGRAAHVVAFDDGFRGVWDERKRFHEMQIRPIVFLPVGLVGQPGHLTWDEVLVLQREYGFNFQCHTWSHQTLVGDYIDESPIEERTDDWYARELCESKAELERRLGKTVTGLCFPVGYYSVDVVRRCKKAGYTKLYVSYPGNIPTADELIVPRNIVQDCSPLAFKATLRGGLMAFSDRYRKRHFFGDV